MKFPIVVKREERKGRMYDVLYDRIEAPDGFKECGANLKRHVMILQGDYTSIADYIAENNVFLPTILWRGTMFGEQASYFDISHTALQATVDQLSKSAFEVGVDDEQGDYHYITSVFAGEFAHETPHIAVISTGFDPDDFLPTRQVAITVPRHSVAAVCNQFKEWFADKYLQV